MTDLLIATADGLWCPDAGVHIDPWRPVAGAIVTHAHSDHALAGSGSYLCSAAGAGVLGERMGAGAVIQGLAYGERVRLGSVTVSLHPAGHLLGSAQVRLERDGEVWVVSGDYKVEADPTCAAFEPIPCHVFLTESTFGLPIYRWGPAASIAGEIDAWWRANRERGRTSVLLAYALGKAQRLLSLIEPIGPILAHGSIHRLLPHYAAAGVRLPPVLPTADAPAVRGTGLVIAPPSAVGTTWVRRFGDVSTAFASGWMAVRGTRRRRNLDRGFVLSDHADWPGLIGAISATGAERVLVSHGHVQPLVRWLSEQGVRAERIAAHWPGEMESEAGLPDEQAA
jgi:putative mRNA 3-end processing factor